MNLHWSEPALNDFAEEFRREMQKAIANPNLARSVRPIVRTNDPSAVRSISQMPSAALTPPTPQPPCRHRQAEPVVLVTGEVVATLCVECLVALPIDYIDRQRVTAERQARCEHDFEQFFERTVSGDVSVDYCICNRCGVEK